MDQPFHGQDVLFICPAAGEACLIGQRERFFWDRQVVACHPLQLSGHTHDGQIFPIGTLCSLLGLNELEYGTLHADGFSAVVSSGAGTWGYPVRTQGISEYVVIDMKKAADA